MPVSINRYFLKIFIPVAILFSIVAGTYSGWNDFNNSIDSRINTQNLVFESFASSIKQPLLQGSFIEVKIRTNELSKHSQIYCIEISPAMDILVSCNKDLAAGNIYIVEEDLHFGDINSKVLGHIKIAFDNSDLVTEVIRKSAKNILGFLALATLLFLALSTGFSRIKTDLDKLVVLATGHGKVTSAVSHFSISEFDSIGKRIISQIEISKREWEAKVAIDMANQVAHDIRAPLTALGIAINERSEHSEEKQNLAIQAIERISVIAEDLLVYSRIKSGEFSKDNGITQTSTTPSCEVVSCVSTIVNEKNLTLKRSKILIDGLENSCEVLAEVNSLQRVLSNIIENAIDATSKVEVPRVQVSIRKYALVCEISILDNGCGIPEEIISSLGRKGVSFDKPNGNGLGLYHAREKLREWSSDLEISSAVGVGTIARIKLKLA